MDNKVMQTNPSAGIFLILLLLLGGIFLKPGLFGTGKREKGNPVTSDNEYNKEDEAESPDESLPVPQVEESDNQDINETNDQEGHSPSLSSQVIIEKSIQSPPAILPAGNSMESNDESAEKNV